MTNKNKYCGGRVNLKKILNFSDTYLNEVEQDNMKKYFDYKNNKK